MKVAGNGTVITDEIKLLFQQNKQAIDVWEQHQLYPRLSRLHYIDICEKCGNIIQNKMCSSCLDPCLDFLVAFRKENGL